MLGRCLLPTSSQDAAVPPKAWIIVISDASSRFLWAAATPSAWLLANVRLRGFRVGYRLPYVFKSQTDSEGNRVSRGAISATGMSGGWRSAVHDVVMMSPSYLLSRGATGLE
jgi:hypothetical protein